MLKFLVYDNGQPAQDWPLRNSYLLGSDGNAMRGDVWVEPGMILCNKREAGSVALALQHPLGEMGEMTVRTCLLPERDEPYLLTLELARHRLMTRYAKLEEWALFDLPPDHPVSQRVERSRALFIEALCFQRDDPARSWQVAQECTVCAIDGAEELALAHSELLLNRRKETNALPRFPLGCSVRLSQRHERLMQAVSANFDFLQLPLPWKQLSPEEHEYRWDAADAWVDWASRHRVPIVAGPLVSFDPANLPDWIYIWEHDYDTVRDLIYEHIERVVRRYRSNITAWNAVSGLHVNSHFSFNFEQLMDITRTVTMLIKKVQPSGKVMIELRQPFGEYYATNPRSIPPMMYADLIVQSAIQFDAFGLRLPVGQAQPGEYARDLMQVSALLDDYAGFNKPIYLSVAAPSEPVTQAMLPQPESDQPLDANSGIWRGPWSQDVQALWLEAVCQIAISKPMTEAVVWANLMDHPRMELPLSGLLNESMEPKAAFRRAQTVRRNLLGIGEAPAADAEPEPAPTPPAAGDETEP